MPVLGAIGRAEVQISGRTWFSTRLPWSPSARAL